MCLDDVGFPKRSHRTPTASNMLDRPQPPEVMTDSTKLVRVERQIGPACDTLLSKEILALAEHPPVFLNF
jgi:hypothetical protein